MKFISTVLILSFSILSFFTISTSSATSCPLVDSCHTNSGPNIRFPFWLINRQPAWCGYPGFELYCNDFNQTILNLIDSGEFVVSSIDYRKQTLTINDPNSCLPNRLLNNVTLTGSPFVDGTNIIDFTFLNCRYDLIELDYGLARLTVQCHSGMNYTFMPKNTTLVQPAACRRMADVLVPTQSTDSMSESYWTPQDLLDGLVLGWTEPDCWSCENGGGTCGYVNDTGLDIGCSWNAIKGDSRNVKLVILMGVGMPMLVCLIVLISYSIRVRRASILRSSLNSRVPVTGLAVGSPSGLDGHIIDSYPKTVLGASRRLPNPNNVTCSICLSDYQAEETLRTIPECNHYFHSDCIDDWLKLNGTCPLCRNLPQPSAAVMPYAMSISSSTLATSDER